MGTVLYKGKWPAEKQLSILLHNGHYEPICRPEEIFKARGTFCLDCEHVAYKNSHFRKCPATCFLCYRFGLNFPCQKKSQKKCHDCKYYFPNRDCFNYHKQKGQRKGKSICEQRFHCPKCYKVVYSREKPHDCGLSKADGGVEFLGCQKCRSYHPPTQNCYIQPNWHIGRAVNMKHRNIRYIFYDIESSQNHRMDETGIGPMKFKHEANLIVAEILCKNCMNSGIDPMEMDENGEQTKAENCCCGVFGQKFRHKKNIIGNSRRLLAFQNFDNNNDTPIEQFLDFLLNYGPRSTVSILIAHNSGKYDFHLLLEKIYALGLCPEMIMTGLKVYSATLGGSDRRRLVFKDSLNFLTCALSTLYDTFGMDDVDYITKKPFFPHFFNRKENLEKELAHLPAKKYYDPKGMKKNVREQFEEWYEENQNDPFCLRTALIEYCTNDVQLLREACIRFRRLILRIAEVDPFEAANTLAKLALEIWRTKALAPNHVFHCEGPLNRKQQQSVAALKFFRFITILTGKDIRTAEWSIGEFLDPDTSYRIDGKICGENIILEYYGCFYHGCMECYPNRLAILAGGKTAADLYEATEKRKKALQKQGHSVHEVWECQFLRMLKGRPALKGIYSNIFVPPPLDPRIHGLRGGRVEPFVLFSSAKDDEVIEHFDIISLYPSVMKAESYPLGAPLVLTKELIEKDHLLDYKGLLFVRIEPPRRMPHPRMPPFLPYRTVAGSLSFPLCAKCADKKCLKPCRHTSMQRSWVAAFVDDDIKLAIELGYKVIDIFEVWHWPEEAWKTGLFADYINEFLKLKVHATGWPPHVRTEEQKRDFLNGYLVREFLQLDPDEIEKNGGLRMTAKLLLNSLWGKLCMRPNLTKVKICKTAAQFNELFEDDTIEVIDFTHLNNNKLDRVVYRKKEEFCEAPETNAVHLAVFITSYARRRLFSKICEAIRKGFEIIYCDTDSLILKRKKSQPSLEQGEFLGDMMSELKPGETIFAIVCAGPKNYSYLYGTELAKAKAVMKIRGFEITHRAAAKLNFRKMVKLVLNKYGGERGRTSVKIGYNKFGRHKTGYVFTRYVEKRYQAVYEKGVIKDDLNCVPYGYAPEEDEDSQYE